MDIKQNGLEAVRTVVLTLTITVIVDRYGGYYSGGVFTAWPGEVPEAVDDGDIECMEFWSKPTFCGIGDTADVAIADLYRRMNLKIGDLYT